ncbi:hypothetical protein TREMEDRAFT_71965 [Tremella mesenterica DSM 1558]|uniref:uncharacterized protein n=1 Tax=Tremella mesenterica (strain ATCC 24925 / CBS 8224 / DSM 1558 / NBRC 9311 / NRRL Y-6157 / RJB 2259-6 / UBC 559-6) TaxID=578456 RepID=UPI0003F49885|nr:uncharacterized protein TREMEDRAFT_71965 [Tremella mesenterica DSM 1558]EIW68316.1 hypothetical protein TREMEDRAFT_71965 [Tremella mesenterica DSM 1558]
MSQSPLARSTRRSLPAFAHTPSRLSKSTNVATVTPPHDSLLTPIKTEPSSLTPDHRYRGASSTPSTPKILYSPYATSSPHAGPSKSASIPFDMAASTKAARQTDSGTQVGVQYGMATPGMKKKRFIRRKPIFQRLLSFPQRIIDRLIYDAPTSMQDVIPSAHLANPIALGIHCVHYLLVAPLFSAVDEPQSVLRTGKEPTGVSGRWSKYEVENKWIGRGLLGPWTAIMVTTVLLLLAAANATYLFTRFRTYDMQLRSARDHIPSPHASPVQAPRNALKEDVFGDPTNDKASVRTIILHSLWRAVVFTFKSLAAGIMSATGHPTSSSISHSAPGEDKIQCLRVWDPPDFCLAFFCSFPPSAPALSHLLTPRHPFLTPLLHLTTTFLLSHLATSYQQLVKDRMLLTAEVMREYDQRFVYKKVFAHTVDRQVQTSQAESLW